MNTLEIIKRVEAIEAQAKDCGALSDAIVSRYAVFETQLTMLHASLQNLIDDFWRNKQAEAEDIQAETKQEKK